MLFNMKATDVLESVGLSEELLEKLSYKTKLGMSLKKNLHYFDRNALIDEVEDMANNWYDTGNPWLKIQPLPENRVKSDESIELKYERYYPDHQVRKVFNDTLGFRALCNDYSEVLCLPQDHFRIADMTGGKANDDGYRGVHVYYQLDNFHYPIEIQFSTLYDRQLNNWLHIYLYKQDYPSSVGRLLRESYENGKIHNEKEFKEVLDYALSNC